MLPRRGATWQGTTWHLRTAPKASDSKKLKFSVLQERKEMNTTSMPSDLKVIFSMAGLSREYSLADTLQACETLSQAPS